MPSKVGIASVDPESAISTNVVVSWESPAANGSPITSYEVQLQSSNGNFMTLKDICDGGSASALASLSCTFQMSQVILPPLSLQQGDQIVAIVRAINNLGTGLYSDPNIVG